MGSCRRGREERLEVQFCPLSSLGSFQSRTLMMGGVGSEPVGIGVVCVSDYLITFIHLFMCFPYQISVHICVYVCGSTDSE